MHDAVNHPAHYTSDPSGVECIEVTEHRTFCIGNAIKYLWRAGLKDGETDVQDLRKAIWYIEREIERLGYAALEAQAKEVSEELADEYLHISARPWSFGAAVDRDGC